MKKIFSNKVILTITIICGILLVAGSTYAFLTSRLNVTNGNYATNTGCFNIVYNINNGNGTQDISGVIFPSLNASSGVNGKVTLSTDSSCNVTGTGKLYLHVNSETDSTLTQTVSPHCEETGTLRTLNNYTTSSTCTSNNGLWVTSGTGLKYAVYNNSSATGSPLSSGYINSINSDIVIYNNFLVNTTVKNYYIFIWMDGYVTDDTYTDLDFSGYIYTEVTQNK